MKNLNSEYTIDEYQLLCYIHNTLKDRTLVHILQRFYNLKKVFYE